MKELLYSSAAARWEYVQDFQRGMGLAFNRLARSSTKNENGFSLTVSRTVAHPSYKEATEEEVRLLLKTIFGAEKIDIWDNVKW